MQGQVISTAQSLSLRIVGLRQSQTSNHKAIHRVVAVYPMFQERLTHKHAACIVQKTATISTCGKIYGTPSWISFLSAFKANKATIPGISLWFKQAASTIPTSTIFCTVDFQMLYDGMICIER